MKRRRPETFSRFTVLTWQEETPSDQKSTVFVSIVETRGSNLPAVSEFRGGG